MIQDINNTSELIELVQSKIKDPTKGLPEEVFLFFSKNTPMINVDLLIKNKQNQTLLTWRDDKIFSPGWHIPGGIIRFKETFEERIQAVAASELGSEVDFKGKPVAVNEVILPQKVRGHFISLLYECTLKKPLDENLKFKNGHPLSGQWAWHEQCPDNLISVHQMYKEFIN